MNVKEMQREVCDWAYGKGWEPDANRSFAEECALMHSEVSEALEAYRTWKFDDASIEAAERDEDGILIHDPPKPEGVASELADVLIRLMHYTGMRGYSIDTKCRIPLWMRDKCRTFGAECAIMHNIISCADTDYDHGQYGMTENGLSTLYAMLLHSCKLHGYDLAREYRRKMDYNRTRTWRHGGRTC